MVRRRGLGATLVAAAVFSVILVAGLSVYAAAQGREGLYSRADAEDSLSASFGVLESAEGVNLIMGVQGLVGSQPLWCPTALATIAQGVRSLVQLQSDGNLTVRSQAELIPATDVTDDFPPLRPYNGSVAGELDLALAINGSGSSGSDVTLSRAETHYVHLGLHLDSAVRDCTNAVSAIQHALTESGLPNCTYSGAGAAVNDAVRGPASAAEADGFEFGVSYSVAAGQSCRVTFLVSLSQDGIQGPEGPFGSLFEEGASALPVTQAS